MDSNDYIEEYFRTGKININRRTYRRDIFRLYKRSLGRDVDPIPIIDNIMSYEDWNDYMVTIRQLIFYLLSYEKFNYISYIINKLTVYDYRYETIGYILYVTEYNKEEIKRLKNVLGEVKDIDPIKLMENKYAIRQNSRYLILLILEVYGDKINFNKLLSSNIDGFVKEIVGEVILDQV